MTNNGTLDARQRGIVPIAIGRRGGRGRGRLGGRGGRRSGRRLGQSRGALGDRHLAVRKAPLEELAQPLRRAPTRRIGIRVAWSTYHSHLAA